MANLDFDRYSIVGIDTIAGFNLNNGLCRFILDEIQDATITGDAETVWQTGAQGRRISSMKRNKEANITATNGFIVGGLMAEQFGDSDPVEATAPEIVIPVHERLTVSAGGATTEFVGTGAVGNEIGWIYRQNRDGSQGEAFAQGATATATTFAYNPVTRVITLPTGAFTDGDMILVFYSRLVAGRKYTNRSDRYAGDVKLICDILVKDICDGTLRHSKLVFPRVAVGDNFEYAFGADMAVQNFTAEAIADACSGDREYFYWVFPADEDAGASDPGEVAP